MAGKIKQALGKPEQSAKLLAVVYASVLLMSAYGPVLFPLIGERNSWLLSMALMPALIAGMVIPVRVFRGVLFHPLFFGLSAAVLAVMVQFFPYSNMFFKVAFYVIIGIYVGRVALFWSMLFQDERREEKITHTFVSVLFFVYTSHILLSALTPLIGFPWAMVPVAILFLIQGQMVFLSSWRESGAALFYSHQWHENEDPTHSVPSLSAGYSSGNKTWETGSSTMPGVPVVYIFLMIFSTGFFNTAILTGKEPFWLIVPILISLVSIPVLERKWGKNIVLWIGVLTVAFAQMVWLVGNWALLSVGFILFSRGYTDYAAWRIGAAWARQQNNPMNQTQAVACYVAATFSGGLVSFFCRPYMVNKGWVISFLPVLPLIFATLLLWRKSVYPDEQMMLNS